MSTYHSKLSPQNPQTAEPKAKALLELAQSKLGMIPNMYAYMSNAPGLLDTYLHGYDLFRKDSGFTSAEQEVVFLVISRENACEYCMAAHSFIADEWSHVPRDVTEAIRNGGEIADAKLGALARFARTMFHSRGRPTPTDVDVFLAAGYQEQHLLQVILAIAVKTLSNYSNHVFRTPVDKAFASRTWHPVASAAA